MACADQSSTPRPIKQVTGPDGAFVRGALPRNSYRQRGPYTMARGGMRGPGMTMPLLTEAEKERRLGDLHCYI